MAETTVVDATPKQTKAEADQAKVDADRGYRRILLHPVQGIYVWQDLMNLHTTPDGDAGEQMMRAWINEYRMSQIG